jgi:hypothetical protein
MTGALPLQEIRQVVQGDFITLGENNNFFDYILQLQYIARLIILETRQQGGRQHEVGSALPLSGFPKEVLSQFRYILGPIP